METGFLIFLIFFRLSALIAGLKTTSDSQIDVQNVVTDLEYVARVLSSVISKTEEYDTIILLIYFFLSF